MSIKPEKRSFVVLAMIACWAVSVSGCGSCPFASFRPATIKPAAHRVVQVGKSVGDRAIRMHVFGDRGPTTFIFAGIHGDEGLTQFLALNMIEHLLGDESLYESATIAILPSANPDGLLAGTRVNANAVDCNRNFPADNWKPQAKGARYSPGKAPGSEPETQAILEAVRILKPNAIVSIHSTDTFKPCNNYDGPAGELAELMTPHNGYPAKGSVGYPTPGSFGTWAGVERKIPTITLELPNKSRAQKVWPGNRDALLALIAAVGESAK
ncbi:MAG: M14 family murein peptide amidase A [Phycisphaerae bacterium]|jgi:protein MpaA|nr:M14 family murein peptide amidase A [Phycisphaerae bacterium]